MKRKPIINIEFPLATGLKTEKDAIDNFRKQHDQDTPGLSLRFYVWLTVGFSLVIAAILWFAPEVDHNPMFALLALIGISVGFWYAIDKSGGRHAARPKNWSANKSRATNKTK